MFKPQSHGQYMLWNLKKDMIAYVKNESRFELVKAFKLAVHFWVSLVSFVNQKSSYLGSKHNFIRMKQFVCHQSLCTCVLYKAGTSQTITFAIRFDGAILPKTILNWVYKPFFVQTPITLFYLYLYIHTFTPKGKGWKVPTKNCH